MPLLVVIAAHKNNQPVAGIRLFVPVFMDSLGTLTDYISRSVVLIVMGMERLAEGTVKAAGRRDWQAGRARL